MYVSIVLQYACDGDDKTWLYENKHLPVHGGKVSKVRNWMSIEAIDQK